MKWLDFTIRDDTGDSSSCESESLRAGTAVRDEFSDEKRLEPLVAEDVLDWTLPWSSDLRCPVEESTVEKESFGT